MRLPRIERDLVQFLGWNALGSADAHCDTLALYSIIRDVESFLSPDSFSARVLSLVLDPMSADSLYPINVFDNRKRNKKEASPHAPERGSRNAR